MLLIYRIENVIYIFVRISKEEGKKNQFQCNNEEGRKLKLYSIKKIKRF